MIYLHIHKRHVFIVHVLFLVWGMFSAQASLIAHYDFGDGDLTDNEVGPTFTLTEIQEGTPQVTLDASGFASFPGTEGNGNRAWLETAAFGTVGQPNFTVSFWWRTDDLVQSDFQGLFSNDDASADSFSWQVDNHGSFMRLVAEQGVSLSYDESNLSPDTWYHTVVRKQTGAGANYTQWYMTAEGEAAPLLIGNSATNIGGLNMFRLGANRNTDRLFAFDMANVKIYNDSTVDLTTLLAEGPGVVTVPEPGVASFIWMGAALLILRRRVR